MAVGGSGYSRETGRKWRWEAVGTAGRQAGSGGGRQWVQPGDRQEVAVGGSGYTCTGAVDESSVGWNTEGRNSAATTNVLSTELM